MTYQLYLNMEDRKELQKRGFIRVRTYLAGSRAASWVEVSGWYPQTSTVVVRCDGVLYGATVMRGSTPKGTARIYIRA